MGKISLRDSATLILKGAIIPDVSWNICQLLDADQWVRGNLGYLGYLGPLSCLVLDDQLFGSKSRQLN